MSKKIKEYYDELMESGLSSKDAKKAIRKAFNKSIVK